jgi:hypothetical protein
MRKLFFLMGFVALSTPLSLEARTREDILSQSFTVEEKESSTAFKLEAEDRSWSLRAGFVRLKTKKRHELDRVILPNQWREPSHGVGLVFRIKL